MVISQNGTSVRVAQGSLASIIILYYLESKPLSKEVNLPPSTVYHWPNGQADGWTDDGEFNSPPSSLREVGDKKNCLHMSGVHRIFAEISLFLANSRLQMTDL